jgi:ribosomal protein S7
MRNSLLKQNFYEKLISCFLLKGKKSISKKIINFSLVKLSGKIKNLYLFFSHFFFKLNCFIELKFIRLRKTLFNIPFSTTKKRRLFLSSKWVVDSIRNDKTKMASMFKLVGEFKHVFEKRISNSGSQSKKIYNVTQCVFNRSNIHFRW